jgi:transcriptional regulator with XRE-family HTH domain
VKKDADIAARFGQRVRELRKAKDLSQETFATACGLDRTYISGIERGRRNVLDVLTTLGQYTRVPYEFPLSYLDLTRPRLHLADNVNWVLNDDIKWLLDARTILATTAPEHRKTLREIVKKKFEVKTYKTDRALTGKDKTNRAKRWEVLPGDFQHATLEQCWSAERRLTADLVGFEGFPPEVKQAFVEQGLLPDNQPITRCPVTLAVS